MNLKKLKDSASSELVNFINEVHPEWEPIQWGDGAILKIPPKDKANLHKEHLSTDTNLIDITTNRHDIKFWEEMEFIPPFLDNPDYKGYNAYANFGASMDELRQDAEYFKLV